mgnify:CR=1 FL=1
MVKVRYIGMEDSWFDYLYRSGATWTKGSVVAVSDASAEKLLKHPDMFEEATLAKKFDVADEVKAVEKIEEPPLVNLEAMTKDQMLAYAQRNFGVILDKKDKAENLRNSIRTKMGTRSV